MKYRTKYIPYTEESLLAKRQILATLSERAARLFVSQEYLSLGKGSQRYVSEVFGLHRTSIIRGVRELQNGESLPNNGQRKKGAGRKKKKP